jgi:uncharacterized protein (TIGR00251 family)
MRPSDQTAVLIVKVTPRSSQDRIVSYANGVLTVKLTAPPVEGAANAALVKLLAKSLGVRRSQVRIKSGEASREKRIAFDGLTDVELRRRLGAYAK